MDFWSPIRNQEKIRLINKRFAMSGCGLASQLILMGDALRDVINNLEHTFSCPTTMKTLIKTYTWLDPDHFSSLLVGIDHEGAHLVDIYGGGYYNDNNFYSARGSGTFSAFTALEGGFKKDLILYEGSLIKEMKERLSKEKIQI